MKVLMVTMGMNIGGAETHIVELSAALAARGIEVFVASSGGVYETALAKHGIPHVTLPLDKKNPRALLSARRGLAALIEKEKFDIVHAHARIPAFICGTLQKKYGFRFVTTDHGVFRLDPVLKKLSNWGEYTFAVSEDIRRYLIENYPLNPAHIVSTVNGINTDTFSPSRDGSAVRETLGAFGKKAVLHVSRLEKESSVCAEALIGAMELLHGKAILVIVGDGAYIDVLRRRAASVNERLGFSAVMLVGARTDVADYIAACDLFVGPSRAAMEAMASGKPTIISGSQGHGGIFDESIAAAAVASNFCFRGAALPTAEILAADIDRLMSYDAPALEKLGAYAREFILQNYSVGKMTDSQLAVYEKIAAYRTDGDPDIMICGYYGYGNAGDDSMLSCIVDGIRRIDPSLAICVMSACPERTRALYLVDAVNRFDLPAVLRKLERTKLFLFGGGNLFQDKTSTHSLLYYVKMVGAAKRSGAKIMIYANGIGPVTKTKNIYRVKECLAAADSISLRDGYSFDFAKKLVPEKNIRLTFDPAVLISPCENPVGEERYFVILPKKNAPDAGEKLLRLISHIQGKYGLRAFLISMYDEEDLDYCRKLSAKTGARLLRPASDSEIVSALAGAALVISSRLHGLIYATAAACPMMSFSDDVKLESYLDYIGLGKKTGVSCSADVYSEAEYLCMMADRVLLDADKIRETLAAGLPMWRTLAEYEFSEAVRAVRGNGAEILGERKNGNV
ncbi:MAG: polysaccharide pyruvyl transferase CsaB [Clostridiales bacterium]|nr:polysaccharide pyruvyl transferase CsaB [Clostridiales bacterium]